MINVQHDVKENVLTIKVDLSQNHGTSQSGKSDRVASSEGFISLAEAGHDDIAFSLNVNKRQAKSSK